jgi:hypothetical protein
MASQADSIERPPETAEFQWGGALNSERNTCTAFHDGKRLLNFNVRSDQNPYRKNGADAELRNTQD